LKLPTSQPNRDEVRSFKNNRRLRENHKNFLLQWNLNRIVGMIVEVSFVFREIKTHPIFSSPSQEFIIMIPWIVIGMLVAWIPSSVLLLLRRRLGA